MDVPARRSISAAARKVTVTPSGSALQDREKKAESGAWAGLGAGLRHSVRMVGVEIDRAAGRKQAKQKNDFAAHPVWGEDPERGKEGPSFEPPKA